MDDLIRRSDVINLIMQHGKDVHCSEPIINNIYEMAHRHIVDIIKIIPTAYSVEKVVKNIKSLSGYAIYKETFDLIIEIVRKGGVE